MSAPTATVHRVRLTKTATGWTAQGLRLDLIEASPAYWQVRLPDGTVQAARSRRRLVHWLVTNGHLVADTEKVS